MKVFHIYIACLALFVNVNTVNAQATTGDFSRNSLGIKPPSGEYEGNVANSSYYKEVTNFFIKYVNEKNTEKALLFLNNGAKPLPMRFGQKEWIVYTLIDQKNFQILDALYEKFPKMFRYSQAIHYACAKSDSTMIDYLMNHEASLDLNGGFTGGTYEKNSFRRERYEWNKDERFVNSPCDCALLYGQFDNLNYIEKKYKRIPSTVGLTKAVFKFLYKDDFKTVKYIINLPNFDPNAVYDDSKMSVLSLALEKNNKEIARILIEKGADVNNTYYHMSKGTLCPLLIAVQKPDMQDMIELLLSKGAKTEYQDGYRGKFKIFNKARSEYKEWYILNGNKL